MAADMSPPFAVEPILRWQAAYRERPWTEWHVVRRQSNNGAEWIVAKCSSERYARRIARLLNQGST